MKAAATAIPSKTRFPGQPHSPKPDFRIRRARRADAKALIDLIVALAKFEKLAPPDAPARKRLTQDGFGKRPRYESWLAFCGHRRQPVAYAMLFETYSSFLARPTLYLEDIFVLPEFRGRGIGSALLRHCIQMAHERGCGRMEWVCLDWNTKAQAAYDGLGAKRMGEWFIYRMTRKTLATAAGRNGAPAV